MVRGLTLGALDDYRVIRRDVLSDVEQIKILTLLSVTVVTRAVVLNEGVTGQEHRDCGNSHCQQKERDSR